MNPVTFNRTALEVRQKEVILPHSSSHFGHEGNEMTSVTTVRKLAIFSVSIDLPNREQTESYTSPGT